MEVLFAPPALAARRAPFGPDDFLVYEDDALREVAKVEAAAGEPWSVVVWIDQVLAAPTTVHDAALALALGSEELTESGEVVVVTADPAPRVVVPGSREPARLREALSGLAGRAAARTPPAEFHAPPPPEAEVLRRQLDRLVVTLTARLPPQPRLLLLVADGYANSPAEANLLAGTAGAAAAEERARAAALDEAARVLAAHGWLVLALPLRRDRARGTVGHGEEYREWRERNLGLDPGGELYPVLGRLGGSRARPQVVLPRLEAALDPALAPLRALTRPAAGAVVVDDLQLAATLDELSGRWRLWYRAPEPVDGALRRLGVAHVRSGAPARAPAWVRSGTPAELSRARLRRLFAPGGLGAGTLACELAASFVFTPRSLEVRVGGVAWEGREGPLRLSVAFELPGGPVFLQEDLAPEPPEAGGRRVSFPWPPGAPRAAVLLEDVARETWAGTVARAAPG